VIQASGAPFGRSAPFGMPAARASSVAVGGVLRRNVNERSSYTVTSAGITSLRWLAVCAL
jgi:hypothetical protein